MDIRLENIGKRFNREWIFRNINLEIPEGSRMVLTGSNGSGKSTLLRIIGGYGLSTDGEVSYYKLNDKVEHDDIQLQINFAAPYFNLLEEYTLKEFLNFHKQFKNPLCDIHSTVESAGLSKSQNKLIKDFSSGMKQRVKLIMSLCYESEIILLDEPTTNLDKKGITWFKSLYDVVDKKKTIIIASNLDEEINLCSAVFSLEKNSALI